MEDRGTPAATQMLSTPAKKAAWSYLPANLGFASRPLGELEALKELPSSNCLWNGELNKC